MPKSYSCSAFSLRGAIAAGVSDPTAPESAGILAIEALRIPEDSGPFRTGSGLRRTGGADARTSRAYPPSVHSFERWFRQRFGATPPIGACLRTDHRERWLRLHSLPESKRYAENESERSEVRRRAWAAASEVLPSGEPVWLVTYPFGDEGNELRLDEAPWMVFEQVGRYEHALFEDVGPLTMYAAHATWPHPDFERLIDAIAQDALRAVWISATTGEVFAPYDGGIDLVVETLQRMQSLRRVFPPDWFSRRPDGL